MAEHWPTALGLVSGVALDALLGDPRRHHPVAAFGSAASHVEALVYRDSRLVGAAYALGLTGGAAALGTAVARTTTRTVPRVLRPVPIALATWAVLGGTSLRREAAAMHDLLDAGDLDGARQRLSHLCGRDPAGLDAEQLARATVESVAENTSDAVVAPLFWGAVGGLPGLLAYRAVNTLDAMVGHRSPRYTRFGWASARLDDLANLAPARIAAALTVVTAPLVGGRATAASRAWRRDGTKHPSPNAGQVEAAFAGALGRTLGGTSTYGSRVESRPLLGNGPTPLVEDIPRAARLSAAVSVAAVALAATSRAIR